MTKTFIKSVQQDISLLKRSFIHSRSTREKFKKEIKDKKNLNKFLEDLLDTEINSAINHLEKLENKLNIKR